MEDLIPLSPSELISLPQHDVVLDFIFEYLIENEIASLCVISKQFHLATQRRWNVLNRKYIGFPGEVTSFVHFSDLYMSALPQAERRPSINRCLAWAVRREKMDVVERLLNISKSSIYYAFIEAASNGQEDMISQLWQLIKKLEIESCDMRYVYALVTGYLLNIRNGSNYEMDRYIRTIDVNHRIELVNFVIFRETFHALPYLIQMWPKDDTVPIIEQRLDACGYQNFFDTFSTGIHRNIYKDAVGDGWEEVKRVLDMIRQTGGPTEDDNNDDVVTMFYALVMFIVRGGHTTLLELTIGYIFSEFPVWLLKKTYSLIITAISMWHKHELFTSKRISLILEDPLVVHRNVSSGSVIRFEGITIKGHCDPVLYLDDYDMLTLYISKNKHSNGNRLDSILREHPDMTEVFTNIYRTLV